MAVSARDRDVEDVELEPEFRMAASARDGDAEDVELE